MILRRVITYICFFFILLNYAVSAQNVLIKKYSSREGLPLEQIHDVVQDKAGKMWFASKKGIINYDGEEWKLLSEKDGFQSTSYVRLRIDKRGYKWALPHNLADSIIIFNRMGGREFLPPIGHKPKDSQIAKSLEIINTYNREVAVGTNNGVYIFRNEKWVHFSEKDGLLSNIVFDIKVSYNRVLVATPLGLSIIEDGKVDNSLNETINVPNKAIMGIGIENDNTIWLVGNGWVGSVKNNRFSLLTDKFEKQIVNSDDFFYVLPDNKNRIHFGGKCGFYVIEKKDGSYILKGKEEGLISNESTSAFIDREKNLWVTSFRGISKVRNTPFENYSKRDGLLENEVTAITKLKNGDYVFAHNRGLTILEKGKFEPIKITRDKRNISYYSRILDICSFNDTLYFTSVRRGLGIMDPSKKIKWISVDKEVFYNSVLRDSKGDIWVGTNLGVFKLVDDRLVEITIKGERIQDVRKIIELSDGSLAFCHIRTGLSLLKNGKLFHYNAEKRHARSVYSVFVNSLGKLLVGTDDGVYAVSGNILQKYQDISIKEGSSVYLIKGDPLGRTWFGGDNGIQIKGNDGFFYYRTNSGLSGNEINRSALFFEEDGTAWIGTSEGLSKYIPEYGEVEIPKPIAILKYFEDISGRMFSPFKEFTLDYEQNSFTAHFSGHTFLDEERTMFFPTLTNIKTGQRYGGNTLNRYYKFTNLPSGSYSFHLKVRNPNGRLSTPFYSKIITISTPFYLHVWFILPVLILIGLLSFYITEYFSQRKYTVLLEDEVSLRTSDLEKSKTALKKSEARYKGLIESQNDLVVRFDSAGKFTFVNNAYCRMFGKSKEEIIGTHFQPLIHPDHLMESMEIMKELHNPPHRINIEQLVLTVNGWRWMAWEDTAIVDKMGNIVELQGVGRDITDSKEQEKMKSRAVFESIEGERLRISRDLHDDLGQILTSAKLRLETFKKKNQITDKTLEGAIGCISQAGYSLSSVIHDLRPAELDKYGLLPSLESLCEKLSGNSNIDVEFTDDTTNINLTKEEEISVYRLIQEALNNSVKHSGCSKIVITVKQIEDKLVIIIEDNGKGFNPEINKKNSFGIINMKQRAKLIGANLDISPRSDNGTIVKLTIQNWDNDE